MKRLSGIFTILLAAGFLLISGTAQGNILTIPGGGTNGHTSTVFSVAYSPDGTKIASGGGDNKIKIWNASTGAYIRTLTGHTKAVYSVAWSSDNSKVISGSGDNTVKIWHAGTSATPLIRTLSGHTDSVFSVAYNHDDTNIVSGSRDATAKIWNASTGALIRTITAGSLSFTIYSVAYSHDGAKLVLGTDQNITIWNASTGAKLHTLTGTQVFSAVYNHNSARLAATDTNVQGTLIRDVSATPTTLRTLPHPGARTNAFSADGAKLVTGSNNGTIKVWTVSTGALSHTLSAHSGIVRSVDFSPDGTRIVSGGNDRTIKIWSSDSPTAPHKNQVHSVNWSPDGTKLVTGSADKTIKIWNADNTTAAVNTLWGHTDRVDTVAFNHDGTRIVSGSYDSTVKIWNASTGALIRTPNHGSQVYFVTYNHDGTRIASAGLTNAKIWNASTGAVLHTLSASAAYAAAYNHDSTKIAVASYINEIKIYNTSASPPSELRTISASGGPYRLAWSPDGTKVVVGKASDVADIYNVSDGAKLLTLTGHTGDAFTVDWSPDGTMIATGSDDDTIKVWHASSGALIRTLTGHTANVSAVVFSPDGTKIASAGADNTVRVWNAPLPTDPHYDNVNSVAWSSDGTKLVSGSADNSVKIWNATSTAAAVKTLRGHTDAVYSAAFNDDGTQVASGSGDNTVKTWNATTGALGLNVAAGSQNINSVAWRSDKTTNVTAIFSANTDSVVAFWNASSGLSVRAALSGAGYEAILNHDRTKFAGSLINGIQLWNIPDDVATAAPTKQGGVLSVNDVSQTAFNHDGTRLVSGSNGTTEANQKVKIWDISLSTPAVLHDLTHGSRVRAVDFSPDGTKVASGGADHNIKIWNAADGTLIRTISGHTDTVNSVAFSPLANSPLIASGSDDDTVRLWNIATGEQVGGPVDPIDPTDPSAVIDPYRTNIESVRFSADLTKLISARRAGYADIWNLDLTKKTAVLSKPLKQGQHWVFSADLSPDGKQIVSAGAATDVQIADAETGLIVRSLKGHTDWTTAAVFAPDGSLIASGSQDNTARLWNAKTGALVHTLTGHTGTVGSAAFSSDGSLLATVSDDGSARVWNVSTGALVHTLKEHTGAVHAAAFSSDNKMLATASGDGTARVWNVSTGALVHTLKEHTGAATAVVFSPTGSAIVTGDEGGTRRVWKVSSGELQATFGQPTDPITSGFPTDPADSRHRGSVQALAFLPDGKTLISCGSWIDILIQELEIGDPPTAAITGPTDAVTGAFDIAITFSESVTGFEASDITVTNGSVSSLTGSGSSYTAKIAVKALFEGTVTVSMPAGAAQDVDKEGSLAATFEAAAKLGSPTVALTGPDGPVGLAAFEVTVEFNQEVSGLEAGDIAVTGGTASDPTGSGASYTVSITPSADAEKATVSIPADAAQNAGGAGNEASNAYEVDVDGSIPTVAVTGPEGPVNGDPFVASVAFSEAVTGFDADDVSVEGGTAASVSGSGMAYKVSIDPDDGFEETLIVSIAAGAANDSADNASQASNVYEVEVDQTAPTVSIDGPAGPLGGAPLNLTITFSESATGFAAEDIAVVGGSASVDGSGMDYTAVVRPAADFEGMLTVSIGEGAAQDSAGNMSVASEAYSVEIVRSTSFTVNLRQGFNLLHVPVNDSRVERLSDLWAVLGGSEDVQLLLSYSSTAKRFVSYAGVGVGSGYDIMLADGSAVLAVMKTAKSVTFTGGLLKREVSLRAGLNMVGVTRSGAVETVGGLTALSSVPMRVIALEMDSAGNARFADATDSTEPVNGGEGYFISARYDTALTFDGGAWKNDAASTAASAEALVYDPSSTPLLVVEGSVAREDNLSPLNGLEVSITNLQTGQTASDLAGRTSISGAFSLPLLALSGDSYAIGDAFDLRVSDSSGTFGGVRTVRIVLDKETASAGRIDIGQLLATAVPIESALLPNYPNPFNPETWIPFELAESSRATITIYNAAGQKVRVLELGQLPAGAYRSRAKAAYWDGRNALGESVASGIYYVRIEAGSFSALRRMVVLK